MKPRGKSSEGPFSIQDVADAAKVSIATVSRVLNNPELVAEATAKKVREVIERLNYKPNPFAQGLITRSSRVLCFALPDMSGEFYSELIRGADSKAHQLGYHLLVSSEARGTPRSAEEATRGPGLGLADGLAIMITEPQALAWRGTGDDQTPVVLIDVEVEGLDCVLVDNATGTAQAVSHLLERVPASRLYFVGGPAANFDTAARATAFRESLARAGHEPREDQVAFGRYDVAWGATWMKSRRSGGRRGPIGVLAGNDEIALGVLQAAEDLSLEVPGDVRVVGFDDTRLASLVRPRLSSVRVPLADVGAAAIDLLATRIEDGDLEPRRVRLATELVIRESSGA